MRFARLVWSRVGGGGGDLTFYSGVCKIIVTKYMYVKDAFKFIL